MRTLAPASAGDVCRRGAQHYYVLAVDGARALCVPVIFDRTYIHRADVSIWGKREKSFRLVGSVVVEVSRFSSGPLRPKVVVKENWNGTGLQD